MIAGAFAEGHQIFRELGLSLSNSLIGGLLSLDGSKLLHFSLNNLLDLGKFFALLLNGCDLFISAIGSFLCDEFLFFDEHVVQGADCLKLLSIEVKQSCGDDLFLLFGSDGLLYGDLGFCCRLLGNIISNGLLDDGGLLSRVFGCLGDSLCGFGDNSGSSSLLGEGVTLSHNSEHFLESGFLLLLQKLKLGFNWLSLDDSFFCNGLLNGLWLFSDSDN